MSWPADPTKAQEVWRKYYELRNHVMLELLTQCVVGDALRLAVALVELTYVLARDAAPFESQKDLAKALGWSEEQLSRAIRELKCRKILCDVEKHAGMLWYELRPCGQWEEPGTQLRKLKKSAEVVQESRKEFLEARRRIGGDPKQRELFPPSLDEKKRDDELGRHLAEASREEASRRANEEARECRHGCESEEASSRQGPGGLEREVNGPLTPEGVSPPCEHLKVNAPLTQEESPPISNAPARTQAGHVHVSLPTVSMLHVHEHAQQHASCADGKESGALRLPRRELTTDNHWDLMQQIEELIDDPKQVKAYWTTWVGRIVDYPDEVFKAIGQTRIWKREGKIKTTVGQTLNYEFDRAKQGWRWEEYQRRREQRKQAHQQSRS